MYRPNKGLAAIAVLFLLGVGGCAAPTTQRVQVNDVAAEIEARKQREIALQAIMEEQDRLNDVAYRVLAGAVPLCGVQVIHHSGMLLFNRYSFNKDMQDTAAAMYQLDEVLKVKFVVEGSPAHQAGIRRGDIPMALDNWRFPVGEQAPKAYRDKMAELSKSDQSMRLRFLRDGVEQSVEMLPRQYCAFDVVLSPEDVINAYADGKKVAITRGMMRFVKNDNELALVVSHELAHNTMKHMDARIRNFALGSIFDILAAVAGVNTQGTFGNIGAMAYSQDFEAEADYVGLYMMALTGLDFEKAPAFWRRMATVNPGNIRNTHTATHPATPQRFVAMEETVKEIKDKIARGVPLVPEMKRQDPVEQK